MAFAIEHIDNIEELAKHRAKRGIANHMVDVY
jgi:hypothetical protein